MSKNKRENLSLKLKLGHKKNWKGWKKDDSFLFSLDLMKSKLCFMDNLKEEEEEEEEERIIRINNILKRQEINKKYLFDKIEKQLNDLLLIKKHQNEDDAPDTG